ncbi:MAG TPA: DUF4007 family protein [Thermoanaerobaculia bacterium]|nr:DUF4007 family protein [Thermoanaerobaculia bacterium]
MHRSDSIQAVVFSGHESFPLRFTWLAKAVRHCESEAQRDLFSRPDAMVRLGVGKNMVRAMRSWALATQVVEPDEANGKVARVRPTAMGRLLFGDDGADPFMEDPATVWLVHWALASNRRLGTWYWAFNELREIEFERGQLVGQLHRASREMAGRQIARETIERDVDCFLRTYVSSDPDKRLSREELLGCPLTELGLIRRAGSGSFTFSRGPHDSLPQEVFAYCLLLFWSRKAAQADSLAFEDVAHSSGSPGQVFKLTENALVDRLYELEGITGGGLRYDDTSGLRQVLRGMDLDPVYLLRHHYGIAKREATNALRH